MRGKFAHISDCHIGAWRDPKLRELNDSAFSNAVELCARDQVDFVIISGDIFDVGIPEMSSVRSAVRKLKQLIVCGIPVYVVYGSHDYSPTTVSVVEVLTEAGLFSNVGEFDELDVQSLSGGERTALALAYRLALNYMVKRANEALQANLLILDEPTEGFSKEQIYRFRNALEELASDQVIIVSHERDLEPMADRVFRIEKVNGESQVTMIST